MGPPVVTVLSSREYFKSVCAVHCIRVCVNARCSDGTRAAVKAKQDARKSDLTFVYMRLQGHEVGISAIISAWSPDISFCITYCVRSLDNEVVHLSSIASFFCGAHQLL